MFYFIVFPPNQKKKEKTYRTLRPLSSSPKHFSTNILLLGDENVGKSTLIRTLTNGETNRILLSIGSGWSIELNFFSSRELLPPESCHVALLCFDLTNTQSFEYLSDRYSLFLQEEGGSLPRRRRKGWVRSEDALSGPLPLLILVGTHADQPWRASLSKERVARVAQALGAPFVEANPTAEGMQDLRECILMVLSDAHADVFNPEAPANGDE